MRGPKELRREPAAIRLRYYILGGKSRVARMYAYAADGAGRTVEAEITRRLGEESWRWNRQGKI